MATVLLSSFQVTLAGYQTEDDSWFSILTLLIAEEESEEKEKEEKEEKESVKDWVALQQSYNVLKQCVTVDKAELFAHYKTVNREVISPPPELS